MIVPRIRINVYFKVDCRTSLSEEERRILKSIFSEETSNLYIHNYQIIKRSRISNDPEEFFEINMEGIPHPDLTTTTAANYVLDKLVSHKSMFPFYSNVVNDLEELIVEVIHVEHQYQNLPFLESNSTVCFGKETIQQRLKEAGYARTN